MATKLDLGKLDLGGLGGKFKINKAQQDMLVAVTIASFVLGICVVLGIYFIKIVLFNRVVIKEKESAILGYSSAIESIGICKSPNNKKSGYTQRELDGCDPNDVYAVNLDENTLRHQVLVELAQNADLESVGRTGISVCTDSATGEKKKYDDLYNAYLSALTQEEKDSAYQVFAMCSALRAIPDALPAAKNELALMSSLDRIFRLSNWTPESITPGDVVALETGGTTIGAIGVNFAVDADTTKVVQILRNIEKSIREIGLMRATATFRGGALEFETEGVAAFTGSSKLSEGVVTVRGDGTVDKTVSGSIIESEILMEEGE